jgi:phospholipase C
MTAFDFTSPDYSWPTDLPDTSNYVKAAWIECETLPDPIIPEIQSMPLQEVGTRVSRALPYEFLINDKVFDSSLELNINNIGEQGAAFVAFDVTNIKDITPLKYTIGSKRNISSNLKIINSNGDYDFHIQGPNGFVRNFNGNSINKECLGIEASISYQQPATSSVVLNIINNGKNDTKFLITDNAYDLFEPIIVSVPAGMKSDDDHLFNVQKSGNWYDITITAITSTNEKSCFIRRFMGRVETGKDSISDPAMGQGDIAGIWESKKDGQHPILPINLRKISRVSSAIATYGKDGYCNDVLMCKDTDLINNI